MRAIAFWSVLTFSSVSALAADHALENSFIRKAVSKSIDWLEADMQTWRKENGCAACHHGPMYLWAINAARRNGYTIQESLRQDLTQWLLTSEEARIFPKSKKATGSSASVASSTDRMSAAMMGHRNLSQPILYLMHGLNAVPQGDNSQRVGWSKIMEHLSSSQNEDGSFAGRDAWRPIFNTPQILTRFVVAGIQDASESNFESAESKEVVLRSALSFLASQPPDDSHQGLILQLLCFPNTQQVASRSADAEHVHKLVAQLKQMQRADGGWAQTQDRESDAFATGQTLTALHRSGVPASDPAIARGSEFLLRTQLQDGTWPMTSRPNPENGKPADLLNPITYAATAWATIGLVGNFPAVKEPRPQ